jgi:hypothetical protein
MERILTSAEARTVPLSRNPLKRLAQLAELGNRVGSGTVRVGLSPLPKFMTRGALVRHIMACEDGDRAYAQTYGENNSDTEGDSRSEEI